MSTETTRPGLARTIRDSVRHGPLGPLTPDEAREAADVALSWLSARLTDDDVVETAALALHAGQCADDDCEGSDLGGYEVDARVALSAAAALIGGGSDE